MVEAEEPSGVAIWSLGISGFGVVVSRSFGGPLGGVGSTCGTGEADDAPAECGIESESMGDRAPELGRLARDGAVTGGLSRGADVVDMAIGFAV